MPLSLGWLVQGASGCTLPGDEGGAQIQAAQVATLSLLRIKKTVPGKKGVFFWTEDRFPFRRFTGGCYVGFRECK